MKKYNIIYADPPWRYERNGVQGAAEKHYPTMAVDELCNLPVSEIAAADSILFLWATFPPRVELFAREKKNGWDAWGNEIDCDLEIEGYRSYAGGDENVG